MLIRTAASIVLLALAATATQAGERAPAPAPGDIRRILLESYPGTVSEADGESILVADRTTIRITPAAADKSAADILDRADLADMFRDRYGVGAVPSPPAHAHDPGRARNKAFFDALYGDCAKGEVERNLVEIVWLPRKSGERLKVTRVNGVAEKLARVSVELDALPARFDVFLKPAAGTYNCRAVAGTGRASAHGWGIAIDIALAKAHYWRWVPGRAPAEGSSFPYRNAIPQEIVDVFERHGFIWGGKWYHYDTMHFEYRPEIIAAGKISR